MRWLRRSLGAEQPRALIPPRLAATANVAAEYERLSLLGRLAAALLTAHRVIDDADISTRGTDGLFDHLWCFLTVGPDTFDEWQTVDQPMVSYAVHGDDLPSEEAAVLRSHHFDESDFRNLLDGSAEILYGNLFTEIDHGESLRNLARVERVAERYGALLPPVGLIESSPAARLEASHGWGARVDSAEVDRLKAIVW